MNVGFHPAARAEFRAAVDRCNLQREGLGHEFAAEVKRAVRRIVGYPEAWTPLSARSRRCLLRRFPFGIVYQVRGETILIVAVMHLHRHPDSWKSRLA